MSLASHRVGNFRLGALPAPTRERKLFLCRSTSGGRHEFTSTWPPIFGTIRISLRGSTNQEFAPCAKTRKPQRRFPIRHGNRWRPRTLLRCWRKPPLSMRCLNECVADPSIAHRWCARFFRLLIKTSSPIPRHDQEFIFATLHHAMVCSSLRTIKSSVALHR